MRAVRFAVAGLIWALTWILPVTFMIMMPGRARATHAALGSASAPATPRRAKTSQSRWPGPTARPAATEHSPSRVACSSCSRSRSRSRSSWPQWRAGKGRSAQRPRGDRGSHRPRTGHRREHRRSARLRAPAPLGQTWHDPPHRDLDRGGAAGAILRLGRTRRRCRARAKVRPPRGWVCGMSGKDVVSGMRSFVAAPRIQFRWVSELDQPARPLDPKRPAREFAAHAKRCTPTVPHADRF
jgi:hypothetical protein